MIITLGRARNAVAKFAGKAGKCSDSDDVREFVYTIVQRLLQKGSHGSIGKWTFQLCNGCFTAPNDLEVPLKVKINDSSEPVWSHWYEFSDVQSRDVTCDDFKPGLFEEVGIFHTVHDLPSPGARVAAIPRCPESDDATVTIQGLDLQGQDVFTKYKGVQVHGETIKISKSKPVFTKTVFSRITGIEKSKTTDYVRLYWQTVDPALKKILDRGLLAEYRPTETNPSYRRFRVPSASKDCCVKITVLGRIKLQDYYHDNDILPVSNINALERMAQAIQAELNEKLQVAQYHEKAVDRLIEEENTYYRTGQDPLDFDYGRSPGSNRNLQ